MNAREHRLRFLEDVADLVKQADENAKLVEQIHQLKTALEAAGREADHYRAEAHAANVRCDHLAEQNMEYRIQLENIANQAEAELDALKDRHSKMAAQARASIAEAEMKPYAKPGDRPLARLAVN